MEFQRVNTGQRVEWETDNNGPIHRGKVTGIDDDLKIIRVNWDGDNTPRWVHYSDIQPEQ